MEATNCPVCGSPIFMRVPEEKRHLGVCYITEYRCGGMYTNFGVMWRQCSNATKLAVAYKSENKKMDEMVDYLKNRVAELEDREKEIAHLQQLVSILEEKVNAATRHT